MTVVTDLGGAHPTWFHKDVDLCFVPSDPVRKIALDMGLAPDQVTAQTHMIYLGKNKGGQDRSVGFRDRAAADREWWLMACVSSLSMVSQ